MPELLENADEKLSTGMRRLLDFLWQEWKGLQVRIESLNTDLEQIAGSDAACVRLQQIPGVGPKVSTAVVSAIGNGAAFKKGTGVCGLAETGTATRSTGGKAKLLASANGEIRICARCSFIEPGCGLTRQTRRI